MINREEKEDLTSVIRNEECWAIEDSRNCCGFVEISTLNTDFDYSCYGFSLYLKASVRQRAPFTKRLAKDLLKEWGNGPAGILTDVTNSNGGRVDESGPSFDVAKLLKLKRLCTVPNMNHDGHFVSMWLLDPEKHYNVKV